MKLVGYDQLVENFARADRMDVRPPTEIPQLRVCEDVFVIPGYDALYDADGRRIDISKRVLVPDDMAAAAATRDRVELSYGRYCPPRVDIPAIYDVIDRPVLFVGQSWSHYGHFLTDVMSRLWALPSVAADVPLLFLDRVGIKFGGKPYSSAVVEALDIKKRLFRCAVPTRLRKIFLPEPAIQHAYRIYHDLAAPHVKVSQNIRRGGVSGFRDQLVYLSRTGLTDGLRKSAQEAEVESRAEAIGFKILRPETLTMRDQIDIFNDARVIAGMTGSAFHTVLFCEASISPVLVQLSWGKVNQRYLMIDQIKNTQSIYVRAGEITQLSEKNRVEMVKLDVTMSIEAITEAARA